MLALLRLWLLVSVVGDANSGEIFHVDDGSTGFPPK